MFAPLILGPLGLLMWATHKKKGWNTTISWLIFGTSTLSMTLYVAGFAVSLLGDKIHGPADSFDWSPVYVVTWPMMLGGWWLSLLSFCAALFGTIVSFLKRAKQGSERVGVDNVATRHV